MTAPTAEAGGLLRLATSGCEHEVGEVRVGFTTELPTDGIRPYAWVEAGGVDMPPMLNADDLRRLAAICEQAAATLEALSPAGG